MLCCIFFFLFLFCVVFFVLLFCTNFLQGVSNGCLGKELTWGHRGLSASPRPLVLLLAGGWGLVSPPRPTQPGLSSDISSCRLEGSCSHRAFASCFLFYRKGVLVLPDGLAPVPWCYGRWAYSLPSSAGPHLELLGGLPWRSSG